MASRVEESGTTPAGTVTVLRLADAPDVRTVRRLHAMALEALAAEGPVRADATDAPHLDTAALQVLIALRRALEARGRTLELTGVGDGVRAFLRQAGLERIVLGGPHPDANDPTAPGAGHCEVKP